MIQISISQQSAICHSFSQITFFMNMNENILILIFLLIFILCIHHWCFRVGVFMDRIHRMNQSISSGWTCDVIWCVSLKASDGIYFHVWVVYFQWSRGLVVFSFPGGVLSLLLLWLVSDSLTVGPATSQGHVAPLTYFSQNSNDGCYTPTPNPFYHQPHISADMLRPRRWDLHCSTDPLRRRPSVCPTSCP